MKYSLLLISILLTFVCFGIPTKVTRIIDGDTFETETGEKVRLVGINAPEIRDIFGEESKTHLINLIEGKIVDLLPDHTSHDRDRYNRLLRYVFLNGVDAKAIFRQEYLLFTSTPLRIHIVTSDCTYLYHVKYGLVINQQFCLQLNLYRCVFDSSPKISLISGALIPTSLTFSPVSVSNVSPSIILVTLVGIQSKQKLAILI